MTPGERQLVLTAIIQLSSVSGSRRTATATGQIATKIGYPVSQSVALIEVRPILVTKVQACRVRVAFGIEASD